MEILLRETGIRNINNDKYFSICKNYLLTDTKFAKLQKDIVEQYKILRESPSIEDLNRYNNLYDNICEYYELLGRKEFKKMPVINKGITKMSPKEYLERVSYDIYRCTLLETIAECDPEQIYRYTNDMNKGDIFPTVYIDYTNKKQEGRHRSLAYYLNNIKIIPVIIY